MEPGPPPREPSPEQTAPPPLSKPAVKLTTKNLTNHSKQLQAARSKPKWALTEQQAEGAEDAEVEELLQFAYELDYEAFLDDFAVR
jgi:hypothetical protein